MEPMTLDERDLMFTSEDIADRIEFAERIGNHRADSFLLRHAITRTARRYYQEQGITGPDLDRVAPLPAPPPARRGLPTTGSPKVFALLIEFSDHPNTNAASTIHDALFGKPAHGTPYESLASYYKRASYGALDLSNGTTLGWYQADSKRSAIATTTLGREALIKETIQHFNDQGHNFSQYDNNGNSEIDYFLVFWTGPDTGWGSFWWGYQTSFSDSTFTVDGVSLGKYSWQWETRPVGGAFNPRVSIHETGHALGLPDFYDYNKSIGPPGGVGGLDMMDANQFDHNCFSKWMLEWLEPAVIGSGSKKVTLDPSGSDPDCVAVWPGLDSGDIFSEFFMVQNRQQVENDAGLPGQGLLIWHVDATLNPSGSNFDYDNSYTKHKLLRLMEADSQEDIEAERGFDVGDFYSPGQSFGPATMPSSKAYDGDDTRIVVSDIITAGTQISAMIQCCPPLPQAGVYTIQQKSNSRFVDAHGSANHDFSVVTRTAQNNDTQRWILTPVGGVYTIQQKSNGRFVDAHVAGHDFSVVTRPDQDNDTQRWVIMPSSNNLCTYTIQQLCNGRHLDAHVAGHDFSVVTRKAQHNDTQRWILTPLGNNIYTIQQKSNGRFVDAHESGHDFSVVTRTAQNNDTQRWILTFVGGVYTIQQKSNGRFVDAHESGGHDFSVVTRAAQNNDTQRWVLMPLGNDTYTIQQLRNGRFVDAHGSANHDFSVVTRTAQNNDTQRWMIKSV